MIELNVFTYDFERVGTIETYAELEIERNYYQTSVLSLTVEANEYNSRVLKRYNVITTTTNLNYGYIITYIGYNDSANGETVTVYAYSLNHLLSWRAVVKQVYLKGNCETILKQLISAQCIQTDANRVLPRFVLSDNSGVSGNAEITAAEINLEEYVFEFCQLHEITVDVLMNHDTKQYEVYTWKGQDLSEDVAENPVKFSKDFENVSVVEYVNDTSEYRSTAYVAGEGEGTQRIMVTVNNNAKGLNRKELFVDAGDLQSTYDDNGVDKTLSASDYRALLAERGSEELSEMNIIETFEGEVVDTQFKYGRDYSVGDIVSFKSERLNLILNTRVTSATITVDSDGKVNLNVSFGNKIPTLLEKIKKAVKK